MKSRSIKRVLFISILCLFLVTVTVVSIYIFNTTKLKNTGVGDNAEETVVISPLNGSLLAAQDSDKSTKRSSEIGNANYFNPADGKYYSDANFTNAANDNTEYLKALFNSGEVVKIPAGNFLCKTKLVLKGMNLSAQGVKGATKIVFDSKTFSNYGLGSVAECLIINANYSDEFKVNTAQKIDISNISFEYKRYTNRSPKTIMLFKNISEANIRNCNFIADLANTMPVTNLDIYNGCKNVTVSNCNFINKTKALSGGCIWVRNLTDSLENVVGNTTENIKINDCSFEKDSKDEVIAIYSTVGNVRNVIINNCKIEDYSDKQEIVLSVYSSEDKYYGTVDNVTISNNEIISKKFNAFVICTGIENRKKPTTNVSIYNNIITLESINSKNKTVVYNPLSNMESNIYAANNIITLTGGTNTNAITNLTSAEGNKISGPFKYGITGGVAINNVISGAETGIISPELAVRNNVTKVKYGIRSFNGDSYIKSNTIELDKNTGLYAVELSTQYQIYCANNTIQTYDANQFGIIAKGLKIILSNNEVLGDGKTLISK